MIKNKQQKVKHIITGNVYSVNKFNKEKHIPYIPEVKKLLPNTLTMTCKQCGSKQTYCDKYSYRRAMGVGSALTQKNRGMCGKCSRSAKRKPGAGQYDRSHLKVERGDWHRYRKSATKRAATQLKIHNPKEYERYINNKYDNVDLDKLSIDHIKEVRECYDEGLSLTECCDISNLQVITMRENILKSNPKAMIY